MGMGPGLPVAMLACARLGAPHTVVFGGFSAESLADRLNDMQCEVLLTQDEGWRRGQVVPLKRNADEALESPREYGRSSSASGRGRADGGGPRSHVTQLTEGQSSDPASCPCEPMDSEDLLYLLYERDDREAEGDRAHDRRLPGRRRDDASLRVRPEARD